MNKRETLALLGALKALDMRGFVVIDEPMIDVWTAVMNREPAITGQAAMQTAYELVARPGATFPTPGDFRAMVSEVTSGLPTVAEARAQIERAMKENYPGMPAKYAPDALVLTAVRQIGGVTMFRNAQSEYETSQLWKRFESAYRDLREKQVTPPAVTAGASSPALGGGSR